MGVVNCMSKPPVYCFSTMENVKGAILALGLGNTLLSDEAVGVRGIEALSSHPKALPLGLKPLDGGTVGLSLLVEMEDAGALVIVDAAELDEPPGTVKVFREEAMDRFLRHRGRSPHDIGLDDLLDALRLRGAIPECRALVAVQPDVLTIGREMTAQVAASVPTAVEAVIDIAQGWQE